jgi:hypothetical protein
MFWLLAAPEVWRWFDLKLSNTCWQARIFDALHEFSEANAFQLISSWALALRACGRARPPSERPRRDAVLADDLAPDMLRVRDLCSRLRFRRASLLFRNSFNSVESEARTTHRRRLRPPGRELGAPPELRTALRTEAALVRASLADQPKKEQQFPSFINEKQRNEGHAESFLRIRTSRPVSTQRPIS